MRELRPSRLARVRGWTSPVRRAFSLVELMVVVGIIGLIAAGLGVALGDSGGNALATGQTTLATLVATARAQAAVNQTEARLLIYGARPPSGDSEKYLRLLQVVRAEPAGSTNWVPVGAAVSLPRGIYVVPPSTSGLLAAGVAWPTNPPLLSTLGNLISANQPTGTPFGTSTAYWLEFKSDGTITQMVAPYIRLLVGTGALSNNIPQFNNSGAVRGLLIRPTGAVTFVNDANSF